MSKKYLKYKNISNILENKLSDFGFTLKGLINNRNGEWLLFIQIVIIFAHFLPNWPINLYRNKLINCIAIIGIVVLARGTILAFRALKDLGTNLTPLAEPIQDSKLITTNSYSYCRHPLYKSLILISLGINLILLSITHLLLLICLLVLLKRKALWEENRLKIVHQSYLNYIKSVPAIMKGVYWLDWRQ